MKIIVQKYGGTSVGSVERIMAVAERIKSVLTSAPQTKLVIVVSAMSGETNRLLSLTDQISTKANPEHKDFVVASGEQVTCGLMSIALEKMGLKTQPFTGHQLGIVTDSTHSEAKIDSINTQIIQDCWSENIIPVVAGFQGVSKQNKITTLGRGGSDTSAVAIAAALKADLCEINTDVDGVYTADPRVVPQAKLMPIIDYDSCLELAALGGKVLHHRCVEIAAKYSLPILVRNSFNKDENHGTYIMNYSQEQAIEAPVVTGVTTVKDVAKMSIDNLPLKKAVASDLFAEIANHQINVDIIVQNIDKNNQTSWLGFSINKSDIEKCEEALKAFNNQFGYDLRIQAETGFHKVSVVGLGMRSHYGVASKMFKCIEELDIGIHMISTSEIKISCLLPESRSDEAVKKIHEVFFKS